MTEKSATDEVVTERAAEIRELLDEGECVFVYGEDEHGYDGWWCQSCVERRMEQWSTNWKRR